MLRLATGHRKTGMEPTGTIRRSGIVGNAILLQDMSCRHMIFGPAPSYRSVAKDIDRKAIFFSAKHLAAKPYLAAATNRMF